MCNGAEFVAVDEIQMCADHERGHIFTDRLLNLRGNKLTMLMGSNTIKNIIKPFKLPDELLTEAGELIKKIYKILIELDASLIEINPLIFTKDKKEFLRYQWTNGDTRQLRGFSKYDSDKPIEVVVSESFMEKIDAEIGDVVTVTIMASEFSIKIMDSVNFFPTLYPDSEPFVIAELNDVVTGANVRKKQGDNQANEIWITSTQIKESDLDTNIVLGDVVNELNIQGIPYGSIFSNEKSLEGQKIDPLVFAGWQTLLLISFGTVALVSIVGFLIHSRVSFKKRNLEFAPLKSIGISRAQIIVLIALEQIIVIGLAVALGIVLGSRLSSTVMPYLISPESSNSLVPPMINSVEWLDFSIVFGLVGILFLVIII